MLSEKIPCVVCNEASKERVQETNKHWANALGHLSYMTGWNIILLGAENCRMAVFSKLLARTVLLGSKLKSSCYEYAEMPISYVLSLNYSK